MLILPVLFVVAQQSKKLQLSKISMEIDITKFNNIFPVKIRVFTLFNSIDYYSFAPFPWLLGDS